MNSFIFYILLSVVFFVVLLISIFRGEGFFDAIGRSVDKMVGKARK